MGSHKTAALTRRAIASCASRSCRPILGPCMRPKTPVVTRAPRATGCAMSAKPARSRVAVKPAYLDDQSDPEDDRYVWSYTVTIENKGTEPVQPMSRVWNITDTIGRTEEVRGPGVEGAQPVIGPGEQFQYTSGCPLETSSGYMVGSYKMVSASGKPSRRKSRPSCSKAPTNGAVFISPLQAEPAAKL